MENEMKQTDIPEIYATEESRGAYAVGKADGLKQGKLEGTREGKLVATLACLQTLMRRQRLTADQAMALLELPRSERKSYGRILATRARQKQAGKQGQNNSCP